MEAIEKPLGDFFAKLPKWPQSIIDFLVRYFPWILIIISVISGLFIVTSLGLVTFFSVASPIAGAATMLILILYGIQAVLGLLGGLRMLSGSKQGWDFALYSVLVAVIANIIEFSIGGLFGDFLMLWALFQLRSYFGGSGEGTSSF